MVTEVKELSLFSKSEAAKILCIGKEKLHQLIDEGKIGFIMMGDRMMIPYKELQNYIEQNTVRYQPSPEDDQKIDLNRLRGRSNGNYQPVDTKNLLTNIMENCDVQHIQ